MSQIFTKQLDYGASIVSDPTGKFRVVCREGSYRRKNKEFVLMHQVERERSRSGMINTEGQETWRKKEGTQETKG